ncbi:hypothetical protein GS491_26405 [Rhodococcus hoagii]|nr:hypothetical protein [Prescottella equi]NKR80654.1 hypothetical protein [Prescottella equi]NKS99414.1 hypothetical protein [Prescottella equi]NKS99596.1 hypothetical protein [Prescottella equi]
MGLADRFPELLRDYQPPDWLTAETDTDDVDLVSSARRSLAASLQSITPSLGLPTLISLRVFGDDIESGSLTSDLAFVLPRFQKEIEAALSADAVKRGIGRLEAVGLREGSTIIDLRPVFPEPAPEGSVGEDADSEFDFAVRRVLKIHDGLEQGSLPMTWKKGDKELLNAVRMMADELRVAGVGLEVTALQHRGDRRTSKLSRAGVMHADEVFKGRKRTAVEELGGYIHSISIDGKLILAARIAKRAKKNEVVGVPEALIKENQFPLGAYMRIEVEQTITSDRTGKVLDTTNVFRRTIQHDEELES